MQSDGSQGELSARDRIEEILYTATSDVLRIVEGAVREAQPRELAQPEELEVGDFVVVLNTDRCTNRYLIGKFGTVTDVIPHIHLPYLVEFAERLEGLHGGNKKGGGYHYYFFQGSELRKVE